MNPRPLTRERYVLNGCAPWPGVLLLRGRDGVLHLSHGIHRGGVRRGRRRHERRSVARGQRRVGPRDWIVHPLFVRSLPN